MKRLLPMILVLTVFGLVLPGCRSKEAPPSDEKLSLREEIERDMSSADELSMSQPASEMAKDAREPAGQGGSTGRTSETDPLASTASRMIIKTASMSVKVDDVDSAYEVIIKLVEAKGGYIQSSEMYESDGSYADIIIKIAPEKFTTTLSALERLGEVDYKAISGDDVTEEYFDLSAELSTQMALRTRLFDLLNKARNVSEAIQVEQELARVDYNVNRIKGRMKYLEQMVAESTISVSLYDTNPSRPETNKVWMTILVIFVILVMLAAVGLGVTWLAVRITRGPKKK